MNRNDLINTVANDTGLQRRDVTKAVDRAFAASTAALKGGDEVRLVGFGTFSIGSRSQREGRNPRTGEKIKIPASKVVKFKAGKTLSEKVK